MFEPVIMARNHNFETSLNCCDIHSISKNLHQVILARYHRPHIIPKNGLNIRIFPLRQPVPSRIKPLDLFAKNK
jgi:hypothetical protein